MNLRPVAVEPPRALSPLRPNSPHRQELNRRRGANGDVLFGLELAAEKMEGK